MSVENRISEKKIITIGDYHTPLPEGWTYKESTKHKGKWYYISPSGQAQWTPPLVKTGKFYEWKLQLFIEFGPGKLGMNLKAVDALPDTLWTQFQVEIHTLRKLGNGQASPAEIYNWSVKPDRRIYAGFRIVEISGVSVAGYTYSEVIEKINKTPRPLVIGFCDCHRGLVGDPDEDELEEDEDEVLKSVYQQRFNSIHSEFLKTMVLTELDKELWNVDLKRLTDIHLTCLAKCKKLKSEIELLEINREELVETVNKCILEKGKVQAQLDKLDMQENQKFASYEEQRAQELQRKQQALIKSIDEMTKENQKLMEEYAKQSAVLDKLYEQLDKDDSNNVMLMTKHQLYDEYGIKRSPFLLEDLHLLYYTLEEVSLVEEQEVQRGTAEVERLKKHYQALVESKDGKVAIDQGNESSIRDLEMKLDWLRDQLHKTVNSITKAEKKGKTKAVKGGYRRRNLLKIEYQLVQDELQMKLDQLGPQPTCPEEPTILEEKTEYIRQALRDVVKMIATCPKDQQQLYIDRRHYLKTELERVMNRCMELGLPMNTLRRSSLGSAPILSERMSIFDSRRSAFAVEDESPPGTPVYYPESLTPPPEESQTPPFKPQTPAFQIPMMENASFASTSSSFKASTPKMPSETPPFGSASPEMKPSMPPLSLNATNGQFSTKNNEVHTISRNKTIGSPRQDAQKPDNFADKLTTALRDLSHQQRILKEQEQIEKELQKQLMEQQMQKEIQLREQKLRKEMELKELQIQREVAERAEREEQLRQEELIRQEEERLRQEEIRRQEEERLRQQKLKQEEDLRNAEILRQRELLKEAERLKQAEESRLAEELKQAELLKQRQDEASVRSSELSVYSLHDSEIDYSDTISVCSEDMELKPNKVEELKNDLRHIVAQITQATKDNNQTVVAKLMKARNQVKSEIALAQDEMEIEAIKQELRDVVVRIAEAAKQNDKSASEQYLKRRLELKDRLKAAQESYLKTQREAKPLDELKNELRSVVKALQRPNLSKDELDSLMQQKSELKNLIIAKQPQFTPHANNVESLKQELRKVVSNITVASKENDTKTVEKLMRRRSELKLAITKAQDYERRSDKSRGSSNSSKSSESVQAQSFAVTRPQHTQATTAKSQSFAGIKPTVPITQPNQSMVQPQRVNESFLSNESSSFGGSSASNSLNDSFEMSETKVAYAALSAFRDELGKINKALEKTTNERSHKKLLDQRADIKARIASTEAQLFPPLAQLDHSWDRRQVKKYIEGLQEQLREVVKHTATTTMDKRTSEKFTTRRGELKVAIQAGLDRLNQLQDEEEQNHFPEIQIPVLSPDMDKESLVNHIELLKKELRQVVTNIAQTQSNGAKSKLKSQRNALKQQLAMAQDQLALSQTKKSNADEEKMLETYIDSLKADLKHVVAQITQTKDMPTVNAMHLRRRNDLKRNLRQAQDQLLALQDRRASSKSSSQSIQSDDDQGGIVLDAFLTTRMTQVYQNVSTKSGYLEYLPQKLKLFRGGKVIWCKLESNGCLVWYKSPSDTKLRGMVDLAQTANRSVKISYDENLTFTITLLSPGMLSNHEELYQFKASTQDEARNWMYVLKDTIELLVKEYPKQQNEDLFGRNSVVY